MTKTVLDHVAVGTRALTDGWDLFGGLLGGSWVYGGDSPGFWWGQLQFRAGPKIELLTPTGGPDAAFLERFLASRGAGPHHFNFIVPDIAAALSRVRSLGIEPVQISLGSATWKEAFLHPKDAHGIVIQVAEQSGPPPELAAPAQLPAPGPSSAFTLVEHYVADIYGAVRLYGEALEGEVVRLTGHRRGLDRRADLGKWCAPATRPGDSGRRRCRAAPHRRPRAPALHPRPGAVQPG